MQNIFDSVQETVAFIKKSYTKKPQFGVIFGTGLGSLSAQAKNKVEIPYTDIPNFPVSTTESHKGNLVFGEIAGKQVMFMEGRFHFYEGYTLEEVTFPVRIMKALGVDTLFVTNAAGGMNPLFDRGDVVAITDHINCMGVNPLIGKNDSRLGPRFPDMIEPYSQALISLAEKIAIEKKIALKKGVYIGVSGPCLETRAEYRYMRQIGADLVGMSTVPEVIVAVHAGLNVFGLSCATDLCLPDALEPVVIEEIIETAQQSGPIMDTIIKEMISQL